MNKTTNQSPRAGGYTVTSEDGGQYFIMGKNRIKITEHFPPEGKRIEELVTALIENKIKENTRKGI